MKKILFLSCNYPYGLFGPSTLCTSRIMECLCQDENYEVHNISFPKNSKPSYSVLDKVHLHFLKQIPSWKKRSRISSCIKNIISVLTYPNNSPLVNRRFYRDCLKLIKGQQFDLVIAQCFPEKCVWAGTWLKEKGYIDQLMVIFWDNLYGKLPQRFIPKTYALRRQRKAEGHIAQQADLLISLYPIKVFHDQYGDLPEARNKRVYLGIPSISRPQQLPCSSYQNVLKAGMINMVFSGTIFRREYVSFLIDLFNLSSMSEKINLIFFARGVSDEDFKSFKRIFRGNIEYNGWIPINDLHALYPFADFFMSYPGNPSSICSKVYEYMSYGKPILLLYDTEQDVNVSTFSKYPAFMAIDIRKPARENIDAVDTFIITNQNCIIPFEETEKLFPNDSAAAYVQCIKEMLEIKPNVLHQNT